MQGRIRQKAVKLFCAYGPHRISLDDLAHELGISKKTIYKYFVNKSQLVLEAVNIILTDTIVEIDHILQLPLDPVQKLLKIYYNIFQQLKRHNPAFLYEVRKYYPDAFGLIEAFRKELIQKQIIPLLQQAKMREMIRPDLDETLFADIHLSKISQVLRESHLFFQDQHSADVIFEYLIVSNVRGIISEKYLAIFNQMKYEFPPNSKHWDAQNDA